MFCTDDGYALDVFVVTGWRADDEAAMRTRSCSGVWTRCRGGREARDELGAIDGRRREGARGSK